ncbi:MAG: hypothetical protein JNM94_16110 [Phycisphaerae bacterium]|nr:hypothetical protein [Phycisphaerae bacterium]
MNGDQNDGHPIDPPPQREPLAPPTSRSDVPALAPCPIPPPRCPKCFFLLHGLPMEGQCPECGAAYSRAQCFEYVHERSFGGSIWRWWWPLILSTVPVLALGATMRGSTGLAGNVVQLVAPWMLVALAVASLANGIFQSYRWLRRRHLRRSDVVSIHATAGLVLGSIGCGGLVFATSFIVVFAGSCFYLLSM